jgi:hypothetical protein
MSIADHFEQIPDASFIRGYDASTARRQFNLSLVLIAAIAMAAAALGSIVRFDSPAASATTGSAFTATPPDYAGRIAPLSR